MTVRGVPVASPEDIVRWINSTDQSPRASNEVTATFVVNDEGTLLTADRHSEHVACAGNRPVRSAGEMCFALDDARVIVTRISNQSTGYCPEPESWAAVVAALRAARLEPTEGFDPRCEFRRCTQMRFAQPREMRRVRVRRVRNRAAARVQRAETC